MPTYKFSQRSQADLEDIARYTVDNWGAGQATRYLNGLEKRVQALADAPCLGKQYDDLAQGLLLGERSFPCLQPRRARFPDTPF